MCHPLAHSTTEVVGYKDLTTRGKCSVYYPSRVSVLKAFPCVEDCVEGIVSACISKPII